MKFGTNVYQIILFQNSSLAIAISAIFKMAATKQNDRISTLPNAMYCLFDAMFTIF